MGRDAIASALTSTCTACPRAQSGNLTCHPIPTTNWSMTVGPACGLHDTGQLRQRSAWVHFFLILFIMVICYLNKSVSTGGNGLLPTPWGPSTDSAGSGHPWQLLLYTQLCYLTGASRSHPRWETGSTLLPASRQQPALSHEVTYCFVLIFKVLK